MSCILYAGIQCQYIQWDFFCQNSSGVCLHIFCFRYDESRINSFNSICKSRRIKLHIAVVVHRWSDTKVYASTTLSAFTNHPQKIQKLELNFFIFHLSRKFIFDNNWFGEENLFKAMSDWCESYISTDHFGTFSAVMFVLNANPWLLVFSPIESFCIIILLRVEKCSGCCVTIWIITIHIKDFNLEKCHPSPDDFLIFNQLNSPFRLTRNKNSADEQLSSPQVQILSEIARDDDSESIRRCEWWRLQNSCSWMNGNVEFHKDSRRERKHKCPKLS